MLALIVLPGWCGCVDRYQTLRIWRQQADFETVSHFGKEHVFHARQWFARVVEPSALPVACVHRLSDKFDCLILTEPSHWAALLDATNLRRDQPQPSLRRGILVGLLARTGQAVEHDWPISITSVRQRMGIAFLEARFVGGFYRPLEVPAYLHLVHLPETSEILGIRLNQTLYGFNVEIEDLHELGIQ
ncbi:MAG: hypothetical protein ACE5EQ_02385 [Phycisphaerae bacterium]